MDATQNASRRVPSGSPQPGPVRTMWRLWKRKRARDRARYRSQVRFRLTREGVHFIGILIFIFIGAVLRDLNLLILLAGAMIGLVVLQWRFGQGTMIGVGVKRSVPRAVVVNNPANVELEVRNLKRWLGAWLVKVEESIRKVQPERRRLSETGIALVDRIRPSSSTASRYQLEFHERGKYEVGPSTVSTRFPLGLGVGWRTVDNIATVFVHPSLGKLKTSTERIFFQDQLGQAMSSNKAGPQEGEFFGLRPWENGDSQRWIHWRTTARLGELSVRQFEQQNQRQVSILLELYDDGSEACQQSIEQAISFVATLADSMVRQKRDKLSVAVAGAETAVFSAVQSHVLVQNLMDHLAVASATVRPHTAEAIRGLGESLQRHPQLIAVSTRDNTIEEMRQSELSDSMQRLLQKSQIRWLNVNAGDLEPYFQWT